MVGLRGAEERRRRAWVLVGAEIAHRIGLNERTLPVVGGDRDQPIQRLGSAGAGGREGFGPRDMLQAAPLRPPFLERLDRPRCLPVCVALGAGVGDAERDRVLRGRQAHRVIAHRRLDAHHRLRHVALDTRTAGAVGAMACVRRQLCRRGSGDNPCTARCWSTPAVRSCRCRARGHRCDSWCTSRRRAGSTRFATGPIASFENRRGRPSGQYAGS